MKKLKLTVITGLFFVFFSQYSVAQIIKVIGRSDLQPISDVLIYNKKGSVSTVTDRNGNIDISMFNKQDTLIFQHTSFRKFIISYNGILENDSIVKLNESSINLEQIVVSASKWEQNSKEIPNKIVTISSKKVAFENPETSADLLGISNEVFIQKSQLGGGSPMIRGFAANSVLLVVDGVRMNNAIYRSGNLQNVISLDPNIIEGVEVVIGPGSIMYGSDALGGVMDFHTKTPKLAYGDKNIFSASYLTRYSSANNEQTGHIDINFGTKKWSSLTSVSFSNFGDLRMGGDNRHSEYKCNKYVIQKIVQDTTQGIISQRNQDIIKENSDENIQKITRYSQTNVMQKIRFRPNDKFDINYGFHYSETSDIPRYDRLIQIKDNMPKYGEWYYGPQKWMLNVLNIKYTDTTKLFDESKITLAYQDYEESRNDRKLNTTNLRKRTEELDIYSVNIDFNKKISKKNYLFYGLETVYNNITSTGEEEDINTKIISPVASRYPDGGNNYLTYAAYLNFKSNISKKITFTSGIRYSYFDLSSKFEDTTFYDFPYNKINVNAGAFNGAVGLVYRQTEQCQFNINASSGFRAPNLDDVAKVFDSEPGNVVVPNKNLKPEYVYNLDLGVVNKIGDNTRLEATFFYTYLTDAMVRKDFLFNGQDSIMYDGTLSKVEAVVNSEKAFIYGESFSVYSDITNHFSFRTNLTYTHGEEEDGTPLQHVAPLFGSTGIYYKTDKIITEFYANYNGEIKNKNLAPSEQAKAFMYARDNNKNPYSPFWFTLNFKFSYQLNPYMQINAGIENILDHRYKPYASGICAPGRNFIIAIRANI
jgi:hemoglobin/transferrin/lactoferrin receptor protein